MIALNKMKKILILVTKTGKNTKNFYSELTAKFPEDIKADVAVFEDVIVDVEEKNTSIYVNGKSILDYDITYFRRAGAKFLWLAATIAVYLDSVDKVYFDSTYKNVGPAGAKLTSFIKLAVNGLPVVPSIYCYAENIYKNSEMIIGKLGLPMVAKELYSQRGLGVSLIKNKDDFEKLVLNFPLKKFMFQKFINKKEEFRVLVLGNKIGSYERKTSMDPNEFRNNVSLGAKEDFMNLDEISDEVKSISIKSAQTLGIEIAGVDVVMDNAGKPWILEVNRGPGFTYKSKASKEIFNLAKFFVEEISKISK